MLRKVFRAFETFVIWCALLFIGAYLIYSLHGESIGLLKIDVLHLFEDNQQVFWKEIFPLAFLLTLFLTACFLKKRARLFTVKIKIKERTKSLKVCYLQIFNKYIHFIMAISILAAIAIGKYGGARQDSMINERHTYLPTAVIIHAMGLINGHSYTNSLEAFHVHYANGQRYFETDFSLTKDDFLVARHDWEGGWQEGIDEENIPTEDAFVKTPFMGIYTPLSLKNIISLMQQYEDVHIITDTKDMEPELARKEINILVETAREMDALEVVDRFVIQIYSMEMYEAIKDIYEFPDYIFTLYAIWTGDENEFVNYCRFCKMNGIRTITMWDYRCADNPKLCQIADKYGISVYVHTVNDRETAEQMFSFGVRGIYTDDETLIGNMPVYE